MLNITTLLIDAQIPTGQNQTPKQHLDKPICDLQFPTNLNLIDKLKESCNTYNSLKDEETEETDENFEEVIEENEQQQNNQEDEDCFYDGNENENSNVLSQTRQDTFLSCNSFLNDNSNQNNSNSINELQIIFDHNCLFYNLNKSQNEWHLIGECNLQLIVDESSKSKYKANILCYLLNDKTTISNDINEFFKFNNVRNSTRGLYWWNSETTNCGLVEFGTEDSLNDLYNLLIETKSNFDRINKIKSPQKLGINQWQPPDILPNKSIPLLDRQITLNLNDNFEYSSVNLNVSKLIDEPLMEHFYLVTISNNDGKNVLFKHCLNINTKFETR